MFTGIIQFICKIIFISESGEIFLYGTAKFLSFLTLGCSVAIDGICLTVVEIAPDYCRFQLSKETIAKTYFGEIKSENHERYVNVELAVKSGDHLNGHVVSGHIYATGTIISFNNNSELIIKLSPDDLTRVTYKGSITINGISLTVANIDKANNTITIWIIPETLKRTTFGLEDFLSKYTMINIEFDIHDYNREVRDHSYFMRLAIQEGELGRATTPPNPWVGCIIIKDGNIIGKGHHEQAGRDHAEVLAINNCFNSPMGSIVYCTLEPCISFNTKRTRSCAEYLIQYNIETVVVGIIDPDVRVGGLGIRKLGDAGIKVLLIEDIDRKVYEEVRFSLRQYIHQRKTGLPYVVAKIALTADGCYRDGDGSQKWITHAGSRQELYKIWSESQVVVLGAGTIQKDNCDLNTNDSKVLVSKSVKTAKDEADDDMPFNFKKVVIDGFSLTSTSHKIFSNEERTQNAQVVTATPEKWQDSPVTMINVSDTHDMTNVLTEINRSNGGNVIQCLVEGGGILQRSFFEADLVNEIVIFRGSKIFGINGHHWNMPLVNIHLHEAKIITYNGENNIMERYLVRSSIIPMNKSRVTAELNDTFDDLDAAIAEFKRGGMVIIVDDESRENEGDLVVAASRMTENQMTEMINNTSGIICAPMDKARAAKLNLSLLYLPGQNTDKNGTPFAATVDHKDTKTGISCKDRLLTVHALANEKTLPSDLNRPGHIFPLVANPDGLTARQGHTEASVTICQLAEIHPPVAVIGELKNQNGTIKNRRDCFLYARNNSLPIISIDQLAKRMEEVERPKILAECKLKLKIGQEEWTQYCFDSGSGSLSSSHIVISYFSNSKEHDKGDTEIAVRIHSECFTGDVLGSELCDCGQQLSSTMKYIVEKGRGVIIFPADHEGRGIGRIHKCKAYDLKQKLGVNTFEANEKLGFAKDARTYDDIPKILAKLKIWNIELLTENPDKINVFQGSSIVVSKVHPVASVSNIHNEKYLLEKKESFSKQKETIKEGIIIDNSKGDREKNMNKAFSDVDNSERNSKFRIGIAYATWHQPYITRIRNKLKQHLYELGIQTENIFEHQVPGTAELSWGVKCLYEKKDVDGAIVVGILLKGDTYHFEAVAGGVFANVGNLRDTMGLPIINAVMAVLNYDQVEERIDGHKSTLEYLARSLIKLIVDQDQY